MLFLAHVSTKVYISSELLCKTESCRRHPSALRSRKRDAKERRGKFTRTASQAMMFVPQSLCISYNYVDIVIYQKINWSCGSLSMCECATATWELSNCLLRLNSFALLSCDPKKKIVKFQRKKTSASETMKKPRREINHSKLFHFQFTLLNSVSFVCNFGLSERNRMKLIRSDQTKKEAVEVGNKS